MSSSAATIPSYVPIRDDSGAVSLSQNERIFIVEMQMLWTESFKQRVLFNASKAYVSQLIIHHTGHEASLLSIDPHPPWSNDFEIPESVTIKATEEGINIDRSQWANLTTIQRFALIKLTRSQHENNNFLPALKEFKLLT